MRARVVRLTALAVAVSAMAYGCSDHRSPIEPAAAAHNSLLGLVDRLEQVDVLRWSQPVEREISASRVIGPLGGTIRIPERGLQVDFPRGALLVPTTITVAAVPGSGVAYTFAPHGLVFAAPVRVRQQVQGTEAEADPSLLSTLQIGYFPMLSSLLSDGTALVAEILPVSVTPNGKTLEYHIHHFSGYVVAGGRSQH
jgi:hypothetical protein